MAVATLALVVCGTSASGATNGLLATGAYHACSTSADGLLWCWGSNSAGELGNGTTTSSTKPVAVVNLQYPVAEVSAAYDRTCALLTTSLIRCWGRAARLDSNGKPVSSSRPVKVSSPAGAHGLSVGSTHACVLDAAGTTWCWGVNDRGQLGDGTTKPRAKPVKAKVGEAASMVTSSDGYSCTVLSAGGVKCWGKSHGTANDPLNPEGLVVNSKLPVTITGLDAATFVSATGDFACATLADGSLDCWGENDHGQLGDGTVAGRATPEPVALPAGVTSVIATANHVCVVLTSGDVMCWGRGDHGQMGNGFLAESHFPVVVSLPGPAATLFGGASGHYTLARLVDGSTWAWGRDQYGQLGNGEAIADVPTPMEVFLP